MYRRIVVALLAVAVTFTLGCDDPDDEDADDQGDEETAQQQQEDEPEVEEIEFVEYDLSEASETWDGWTIEGKEGLDVSESVGTARLTEDGFEVWDLRIDEGHHDLEERIETVRGFDEDDDGLTVEIVEDDEDLLVYSRAYDHGTSWFFIQNMTVGDTDIHCYRSHQHGASSEPEMQQELEACETISAPDGDE